MGSTYVGIPAIYSPPSLPFPFHSSDGLDRSKSNNAKKLKQLFSNPAFIQTSDCSKGDWRVKVKKKQIFFCFFFKRQDLLSEKPTARDRPLHSRSPVMTSDYFVGTFFSCKALELKHNVLRSAGNALSTNYLVQIEPVGPTKSRIKKKRRKLLRIYLFLSISIRLKYSGGKIN